MGDLLEFVDYLSFAVVIALVPLFYPKQNGRLRRLAWTPIISVSVWFVLVAVLYLVRGSLGESYGWIILGCLVSIVFAVVSGVSFIIWSVRRLLISSDSRRAVIPYIAYACCVGAIGAGMLIRDLWRPPSLALVMVGCAFVGLVVWWFASSRRGIS